MPGLITGHDAAAAHIKTMDIARASDPDQQSLFDVAPPQVSVPDPFAGHRPVALPRAGARIRYQAPEGVRTGVIWCAAPGNHVWVTPADGAPRFELVGIWATTRPGNVRGELSQETPGRPHTSWA